MEHGAPEQEKKDQTLLKVLGAGFGCLILVAAGGLILFTKFSYYFQGPAGAVERHIGFINNGDFVRAYSDFTVDYRREFSVEDFRSDLERFDTLLPCSKSSFTDVTVVKDKASLDGTLTGRDGAVFRVHYELIKVKRDWRIQSFQWTSPGERISI